MRDINCFPSCHIRSISRLFGYPLLHLPSKDVSCTRSCPVHVFACRTSCSCSHRHSAAQAPVQPFNYVLNPQSSDILILLNTTVLPQRSLSDIELLHLFILQFELQLRICCPSSRLQATARAAAVSYDHPRAEKTIPRRPLGKATCSS